MTPEEKEMLVASRDFIVAGDSVEAVRLMVADSRFTAFLRSNPQQAPKAVKSDDDLKRMTFLFLMCCLYRRDYESAALLCWGPDVFTAEPRSVKMVWNALKTQRRINILGAASMGKTYGCAAYLLLDYCLDPTSTLIRVLSTKEKHLKENAFGDFQRLFLNSSIPMPGKADTESIATETGKRSGQGIFTMVLPRGPDAGGTIKGSKVKPRPNHPLFGTNSRTRLLIDEAQEVQENAFDEIPNLYSSLGEGDNESTKIILVANPKDEFSEYGKQSVPVGGWDRVRARECETDEWKSEKGWHCIRLNALKSENFIAKKEIFKRFFTYEGYKEHLMACSGDVEHPRMWGQVYGMFCPTGSMSNIIQKHWADRCQGEWLFESATVPVGGHDVGFSGDAPSLASGRVGKAVAWTDYEGKRHDLGAARWVIQLDAVGILPLTSDLQILANEVMSRVKPLGIKPQMLAVDRTGIGQGVLDALRHQWVDKVDGQRGATTIVDVMGVHYSESPSESRISEEDSKSPKEIFSSIIGELWYGAGRFFEHDCIRIGRGVDTQTITELVNRRGGSPTGKGKLLTVESKDDFKQRNSGKSPDRADAVTLLIYAARQNVAELKPKAPDTTLERPKIPSIFDKQSNEGLRFGEALDMGWKRMGMSKAMDVNTD